MAVRRTWLNRLLYFSLTTVATVSYGDASASGRLARSLVSFQLVFKLVFVATLVGLFQGRLRSGKAQS